MRLLITGGTGFIGHALIQALQSQHQITVLSRDLARAQAQLGPEIALLSNLNELTSLDGFDGVINLAGEPIAERRWSQQVKQRICDSRWQLTEKLVQLHQASQTPPHTWINASAIGVYGDRGQAPVDESTEISAHSFAERVCQQWEAIAEQVSDSTRLCIVRIGIVLHPSGGALKKMLPPFKLGLGGPIGNGKQMVSWIHRDDMVALLGYLLHNEQCRGIFNATAPNPVSNLEFSRQLGRSIKRPALISTPAAALRLAFGEMSELLLSGQAVLPSAALAEDFEFHYPQLEPALQALFRPSSRLS